MLITPEGTYDEAIRYLTRAELAIQDGRESEAALFVQMADVLTRLSSQRPRGPRRGPDFVPPVPPTPTPVDAGTDAPGEEGKGRGLTEQEKAEVQRTAQTMRPADTRLAMLARGLRPGGPVQDESEDEVE